GATVTEIEPDHLFYLMARGIDEKTARGLLVKAFIAEVIEELENEPVVQALEAKLEAWFAKHGQLPRREAQVDMDQKVEHGAYDVEAVRRDFPILAREVYGKPLVYLDNAASAQKPQAVIDAVTHAYSEEYANVHRGLHFLSNTATE